MIPFASSLFNYHIFGVLMKINLNSESEVCVTLLYNKYMLGGAIINFMRNPLQIEFLASVL